MSLGADQRAQSLSDGSNPAQRRHSRSLTELREQGGLSLRELEAKTGIHRGRLSELERGLRWPKTSELRSLEAFYDVPGLRVAWLIVVDEDGP